MISKIKTMFIMKTFLNIPTLRYMNKVNLRLETHEINNCNSFHSSVTARSQRYKKNSIQFAFSVMEKNGYVVNMNSKSTSSPVDYESNLMLSKINEVNKVKWFKETPQTFFKCFTYLSKYCNDNSLKLSDKRFDNFLINLNDKISLATDEELKSIFLTLSEFLLTESGETKTYKEICLVLDIECLNRIHTMSVGDKLTYMFYFYFLNFTYYSVFCTKCISELDAEAEKLTKAQFVQTMFHIPLKRTPHLLNNKQNLKLYFQRHFSEFQIDEVAIISLAFFRTQTPITDIKLLTKIIKNVIEHSSDMHEISLTSLLKLIRISRNNYDEIYNLLDCLQYQVPRLSVMCSVHMALVGQACLIFHESCLKAIAEKCYDLISTLRTKDLERLALTFGTFSFVPPTRECFFNNIIVELSKDSRIEEINKHPLSFAMSIVYLGYSGVYPRGLMGFFLNRQFLHNAYGKHFSKYKREVLTIHNTATIMYNGQNISDLKDEEVIGLSKMLTNSMPYENKQNRLSKAEKMFVDIKKMLIKICGGAKYVVEEHILSHHPERDIIICSNHQGDWLPVLNAFAKEKFGIIRYPPNNNFWIVIIIVGGNGVIKNYWRPVGRIIAKKRELTKLGYYATIISCQEYELCRNYHSKSAYIENIINNVYKRNK